MAGITNTQAEAQLALYLAAEAAVLTNQSYEIAGRKLTRANLAEIQAGIAIWNERAKASDPAVIARCRGFRSIVPAG